MNVACSTHVEHDKLIQNAVCKASREEATCNALGTDVRIIEPDQGGNRT